SLIRIANPERASGAALGLQPEAPLRPEARGPTPERARARNSCPHPGSPLPWSDVAAVLVHIDRDGARPHASSLMALAAGRHVVSSWGATLYAALIAHNTSEKRSPDSTAQVVSAARVPGI